jgi:anaerobic selenocysteine-containing dehydrogenase
MVMLSSTRMASEYCRVKVGRDVAALKGIVKRVFEAHEAAVQVGQRPVLDVAFIEQDKRAKVFIGLGGNFVAVAPDRAIVEAALRRLRLIVAISTKLNRGHGVHGKQALILPCLARSDIDMQKTGRRSISVEDSMSMVHASSGRVHPPSEYLKSEVSIVSGIAKATLLDGLIDWSAFEENYDLFRGRIVARLQSTDTTTWRISPSDPAT